MWESTIYCYVENTYNTKIISIRYEVWGHMTTLISPVFIEVFVQIRGLSGHVCVCQDHQFCLYFSILEIVTVMHCFLFLLFFLHFTNGNITNNQKTNQLRKKYTKSWHSITVDVSCLVNRLSVSWYTDCLGWMVDI